MTRGRRGDAGEDQLPLACRLLGGGPAPPTGSQKKRPPSGGLFWLGRQDSNLDRLLQRQ